ncbi:MAG: hypothetical protein ABJF50_01595 [Paracoccaceae bacterium]|uniref:hypothetical protein n=1 Tax=Sulfitobacter pontiacus TaxID=60137 RepID=UPI00327913BF
MKKHVILGCLMLGACGPMSPDRAADVCEDRARAAQGPTGEIGVGVGSGGTSGSFEIGVTSDYLQGRDPYQVYENCVRQKTGQGPIRPLEL